MEIRGIRLPRTETFPCSRRTVKDLFAKDDLAWVSFGSPIRSFQFDNHVSHRPSLVGPVVASLIINRQNEAHLCLFPVSRELYPTSAQDELCDRVLPRLRDWLASRKSRPATAVLGHEQIIAEWVAPQHRLHEFRFL